MLTAIVGILLGNLLIATFFAPALARLRDILDKFASIELPHNNPFEEELTAEQRHRAEKIAQAEFNKLFREYVISYQVFRKIAIVFVIAIILLACAVVWQTPLDLTLRLLVMGVSVATIVVVGLLLKRAVAPTPGQLVSIDFLQNNFANLHLESLVDCSHFHVNFGQGLMTVDPMMHFGFFQKLLFLGYRFFLAITNDDCSRVYFASYGQLDSSSNFRHCWTPAIRAFEIPLGDFSYSDALKETNVLNLHLWLFIPTAEGWLKPKANNPYFLSEEITSMMGNRVGIKLCSSDCHSSSLDTAVNFDRKSFFGFHSWSISRIDVAQKESPQAVLQTYKKQIEQAKNIISMDLPSGRR